MKDIRLLVLDVDGTLTDGKIYMGAEGEVCKAFSIKDGLGLRLMAALPWPSSPAGKAGSYRTGPPS